MTIQDRHNRYASIFLKMLQEQYKPDTDGPPQSFLSAKIALFANTLQSGTYTEEIRETEVSSARKAAEVALYQFQNRPINELPVLGADLTKEGALSDATQRRGIKWPSIKFWLRYSFALVLLVTYIVSNIYFKDESRLPAMPDVTAGGKTEMTLDVEVADFNNKSLTVLFTPVAGNLIGKDEMLRKDIVLDVDSGRGVIKHLFKAEEPIAPFATEVDIDKGDILDYPFDEYEATIDVQANAENKEVPIKIVLRGVPHGLKASMVEKSGAEDEVGEQIFLERSPVGLFSIGLAVFSVVLVAISTVWVAYYLIITRKPFGFDVLVWTAALLFVIPTVRDALPGKPPLGSSIDFLVFFWLQMFVAFSTLGLVLAWYRNMRRLDPTP